MLPIALLLSACPSPQSDTSPPLPAGVNEKSWRAAAKRVDGFRFDKKNLTIRLFANTDQIQDPTAICFDDQNRLYVAESHRFRRGGVDDNRQRLFWFLDDISSQKVEDRLRMYKKWESKYPLSHYTKYSERIITLEDRNGDGMAEHRVVYADKFNDPLDGPAIGLIAKEGKVYLTCIPHVWILEDTDADGVSDKRRSIQDGFGVRVSLSGHDMHGLAWGPDGKLYWSIGDRGYNISPTIKDPTSGAVFRCELDGSNLEVVATGFRNPQELAFDNFGNLFTGDNNSDSGDLARWTEVIQGGDTGWRMYYQYQEDRGPFNREKIWHPFNEDTPAYIIPPIQNFADGPSGLEHYPGTGFGVDFNEAGLRAHLNFGHTVGHAVETITGWSHGRSVAVGMVAAGAISSSICGFDSEERIVGALTSLGLPVVAPDLEDGGGQGEAKVGVYVDLANGHLGCAADGLLGHAHRVRHLFPSVIQGPLQHGLVVALEHDKVVDLLDEFPWHRA